MRQLIALLARRGEGDYQHSIHVFLSFGETAKALLPEILWLVCL
jgi:hypothetical protein